jgi:hypothetical protein
MDQLYLDHVAHKYCKVNANAFIALRYPTAGSDKDEEVIKLTHATEVLRLFVL